PPSFCATTPDPMRPIFINESPLGYRVDRMGAACEAKPSKGRSRLRERREAQDRRCRPRVLAAADAQKPVFNRTINEAARRRAIERGRLLLLRSRCRSNEAEE